MPILNHLMHTTKKANSILWIRVTTILQPACNFTVFAHSSKAAGNAGDFTSAMHQRD